jgi:two-component system, OmpR family, sensor histidine kinase KdpD
VGFQTSVAQPWRRTVAGLAVTVGGIALATGALVPFRDHISADAAALVLVVPVVLGVIVGGFPAAVAGVIAGFLAYDFFFIRPFHTLSVGRAENWIGLVVYAVVGLAVGLVVDQLQRARLEAQRHADETQVLYDLSRLIAAEPTVDAGLHRVLRQLRGAVSASTTAVVSDEGDTPEVTAIEGDRFHDDHIAALGPILASADLSAGPIVADQLTAIPLDAPTGRLGFLVVAGDHLQDDARRLLVPFAKQMAITVERARLAEEATRSKTLEEVDRLRSALMGAVSHDLRTPLACIKASVSDLLDSSVALDDTDRVTLLSTIEDEADRLTRLVANLLDMSRIEAGALEVRRTATPIDELVETVVNRLGTSVLRGHPVTVDADEDLPLGDIDYVLIDQLLTNLLENAAQHGPDRGPIRVHTTCLVSGWIDIHVVDQGPGIDVVERDRIFGLFYRLRQAGPRPSGTGLGLAICHAIALAHGGRIWIESTPGGGATFVVRLPAAVAQQRSGPLLRDLSAE